MELKRVWSGMRKIGMTPAEARGMYRRMSLDFPLRSIPVLQELQKRGLEHDCLQIVDRALYSLDEARRTRYLSERGIKQLYAIKMQLRYISELYSIDEADANELTIKGDGC